MKMIRLRHVIPLNCRQIVTIARQEHEFVNPIARNNIHVSSGSKIDHQIENEDEIKGTLKAEMDDFTREFMSKRIQLSGMQRLILGAGSSIAALVDPRRY